jgi:hypothetical protein
MVGEGSEEATLLGFLAMLRQSFAGSSHYTSFISKSLGVTLTDLPINDTT